MISVSVRGRHQRPIFLAIFFPFVLDKTGLTLTNRSERVFRCDTLSLAYWIQWLSSAVTWEHISYHVHDSVSNVPHLPAVNNRVQR